MVVIKLYTDVDVKGGCASCELRTHTHLRVSLLLAWDVYFRSLLPFGNPFVLHGGHLVRCCASHWMFSGGRRRVHAVSSLPPSFLLLLQRGERETRCPSLVSGARTEIAAPFPGSGRSSLRRGPLFSLCAGQIMRRRLVSLADTPLVSGAPPRRPAFALVIRLTARLELP